MAVRSGVVAGCTALVAIGAFQIVDGKDDPNGSRFPDHATAVYPDGSSATTYKNVGEMVATAAFVLEGEVLRVEHGDPVQYNDGSGDEIVPRILVVKVRDLLHQRGPKIEAPSTLRVIDGYWQDEVGYERESTGWATQGQVGYFMVSRDRAPDGSYMSTYSPLNGEGVVLVEGDRVKYAPTGRGSPWGSPPPQRSSVKS